MNCLVSSVVGAALLGGSFLTLTVTEEQHDRLRRRLDEKLATIYDAVAAERRNQYLQGLVLGVLVAFMVSRAIRPASRFYQVALYFAITLMVALFYYLLMPKTTYMLEHLNTREQNLAWLDIYKTMKMRYLVGLLLGAAAAVPLASALC